jgi:hypothetical protein
VLQAFVYDKSLENARRQDSRLLESGRMQEVASSLITKAQDLVSSGSLGSQGVVLGLRIVQIKMDRAKSLLSVPDAGDHPLSESRS